MFLGEIYTSSSSSSGDDADAPSSPSQAAETHRRMVDSWRRILRDGADAAEISRITRYVQIPKEAPTLAGPRLNPELRAVCEDELAHIQHQLGKAVAVLTKIIRERAQAHTEDHQQPETNDLGGSKDLRGTKNNHLVESKNLEGSKNLPETKNKDLVQSKNLDNLVETKSKDLVGSKNAGGSENLVETKSKDLVGSKSAGGSENLVETKSKDLVGSKSAGGSKDLVETKSKDLVGSKNLAEELVVREKDPEVTRRLGDAVKLLVDVQHKLSVHRRELIYAQLGERDLRSSCRDSPVDEVLFDRAAVKRCCKGTGVRLSGVDCDPVNM